MTIKKWRKPKNDHRERYFIRSGITNQTNATCMTLQFPQTQKHV
jgi:hypothetical protein